MYVACYRFYIALGELYSASSGTARRRFSRLHILQVFQISPWYHKHSYFVIPLHGGALLDPPVITDNRHQRTYIINLITLHLLHLPRTVRELKLKSPQRLGRVRRQNYYVHDAILTARYNRRSISVRSGHQQDEFTLNRPITPAATPGGK